MVNTGAGEINIFRVLDQNQLEDMNIQEFWYFGLKVMGNVKQVLPIFLTVSALTKLYGINATEIRVFYDRVRSDMIAKAIGR